MMFDLWINRKKVETLTSEAVAFERLVVARRAGAWHAAVYTTDGELIVEWDA